MGDAGSFFSFFGADFTDYTVFCCAWVKLRAFGRARLSLLWLWVIIPMPGQGHDGRGFPHEPAGFPPGGVGMEGFAGFRV